MVRLRTESFAPLLQLREEFDRVYKSLFRDGGGTPAGQSKASGIYPSLNIWEEADALKVEAELPGLKADDLDLTVLGSELTIQGRITPTPEGQTVHRCERPAGDFRRVVRLPIDVEGEKIVATLNNGVLLITLPKAAGAKPQKIKVNVG
ncbi:MAG: Hsp20/alpha crystallin family protein [Planctomycetes bacterium]|nr:Hsp20/alpha crystallin family protein [Planctomycetota bacterium]